MRLFLILFAAAVAAQERPPIDFGAILIGTTGKPIVNVSAATPNTPYTLEFVVSASLALQERFDVPYAEMQRRSLVSRKVHRGEPLSEEELELIRERVSYTFSPESEVAIASLKLLNTARPPGAKAIPPQIPADLRAKLWRAVAEDTAAQAKARQTAAALAQISVEMQKVCGENFRLSQDAQGEPVCIVKPLEKPAEKPPAKK